VSLLRKLEKHIGRLLKMVATAIISTSKKEHIHNDTNRAPSCTKDDPNHKTAIYIPMERKGDPEMSFYNLMPLGALY